jgi:hypothetical protein
VHQQALVGEQPERLPEGVAADLESNLEELFGQLGTRWEYPFGDSPAEHIGDPFGRTAPVEARGVVRNSP